MKEYEVTVRFSGVKTFYLEAENLDEAKAQGKSEAAEMVEKHGVQVEDIEEVDVSE